MTEPVRIVRADSEGERVAAEWLRGGGIAVVPTDTVYGLAARPADADAVQAVYRVKGRPEGMHLPVLAASVAQVRALGVAFTPGAEALARRWWPGPLTLAFGFAPRLDRPAWLDGRAEVAVRIPDHDFLRALLERTGVLVVTSANPHGAPTPRTAARRGGRSRLLGRPGGRWWGAARRPLDVGERQRTRGVRRARRRTPADRHRGRPPGGPVSRTLLAIETSCDETAAAVVDETLSVRSSVVASQIDLHAAFGGVVPELASRAHLETVTPIVERALHEAGVSGEDLTAVAVTSGPGLVGALLVGIATAKALALGWGIPVVGVNHLEGHLASVYLADPEVPFPQLALLVSGGHCMLTRCTEPGRYELLGETVDDSIGEAYDKVARFLGLGYPGGPVLDRLAAAGEDVLAFPRPMLAEGYAFSFSGLKTAVVNHVRADPGFSETEVAASFVAACMDVLIAKLRRALQEFGDPALAIVGGVAASPILRARAQVLADEFGARLLIPPHAMATDNAAMIGVAGWHKLEVSGASAPSFGPEPDLRLQFS